MKNVYLKPRTVYYSIGDDDFIEEYDLVRFPKDDVNSPSPYKPENYNPLAYHYAKDELTAWVGKTRKDILKSTHGLVEIIEIIRAIG